MVELYQKRMNGMIYKGRKRKYLFTGWNYINIELQKKKGKLDGVFLTIVELFDNRIVNWGFIVTPVLHQ